MRRQWALEVLTKFCMGGGRAEQHGGMAISPVWARGVRPGGAGKTLEVESGILPS